jgi:hypothetical protein
MVICGSYMHKFSVGKDMIFFNNDKRRKKVVVRKVAAYLCLTIIIKELKISVEHDRVVTTPKPYIGCPYPCPPMPMGFGWAWVGMGAILLFMGGHWFCAALHPAPHRGQTSRMQGIC